MATIKNININGSISKLSEGVYDVTEQNNGTHYHDISDILSNTDTLIPSNERFPGMQIKFIQETLERFYVVRTDNLSEQPTGTPLNETTSIQTGTYYKS